MATYFLKAQDGNTYGPVGINELRQWLAEGRIASDSVLSDSATGESFSAGVVPGLFADPNGLPPIVTSAGAPPIMVAPPTMTASPITATDHMVPTKNPNALWSYYTGLFSIIPCFGLILGPIALVLGRKGLKDSESLPERIGRGHAITGLVLGGIGSLISYGIVVLVCIGLATGSQS